MGERSFFGTEARVETAKVVAAVESFTSAELVVAVRRVSGHYRHTDYLVGAASAMAVLCALLFLPQSFPIASFPFDVAVGFALGVGLSAFTPPLRRLLSSPRLRSEATQRAALAAFHELGVTQTSGRTGILVFVSMFERRVSVVHDSGIDPDLLGDAYAECLQRVRRSVTDGPDFERFLEALRAMGPLLGQVHERSEDDVNELPDGMEAAWDD